MAVRVRLSAPADGRRGDPAGGNRGPGPGPILLPAPTLAEPAGPRSEPPGGAKPVSVIAIHKLNP